MFKGILVSAVILASAFIAQARSLHPCTPTVEMQPSYQTCREDGFSYHITIQIWASPWIEMCQGENRVVRKTAIVEISEGETQRDTLRIQDGNFSYTLGASGDGTFMSEENDLDLVDCVSPLHGGFSISN